MAAYQFISFYYDIDTFHNRSLIGRVELKKCFQMLPQSCIFSLRIVILNRQSVVINVISAIDKLLSIIHIN